MNEFKIEPMANGNWMLFRMEKGSYRVQAPLDGYLTVEEAKEAARNLCQMTIYLDHNGEEV